MRFFTIMRYFLITCFIFFPVSANVNEICSYFGGKDYLINFPQNSPKRNDKDLLLLSISNTADVQTTVNIYSPYISHKNLSLDDMILIDPSEVRSLEIPYELELKNIEISNKSLVITSSENIIVNVAASRRSTDGMYLAYPTNRLGKTYIVLTYESDVTNGSSESVVAVSSPDYDTLVNFRFNKHIEITLPNDTTITGDFSVTLERYETIQLKHTNLSGSIITASKEIFVVSGNEHLKIEMFNKSSRDSVYEQLLPVHAWSNEYLVVPSGNNQDNGEIVRIYCAEVNTTVTRRYNDLTTTYFLENPGDSADFFINKSSSSVVTGDKNIAVIQIGVPVNVSYGDQYMYLTHPTSAFVNTYNFIVPSINVNNYYTSEQNHGIILYANEQARSSTFLDDILIPQENWTRFDSFYYVDIPVTEGLHQVRSTATGGIIGGYSYGEREISAYAMSIGSYICEQGQCEGDVQLKRQQKGNSTTTFQQYVALYIDALQPMAVLPAISTLDCAKQCQDIENCALFYFDLDLYSCEIFNKFAVCSKEQFGRRQRLMYQKLHT